ncbi:uncharacterized protein FSUBG_7746 [Fusarium subglutinans]|uniref:Uncharacterized protein n=1 Tax=Gibberella subglutinans TaxID=42677 RepID=A0A8H5PT68_GIBSU|nr:uncharacterized protein FSUBG_7746 [Fusarium subglutinans]KAF5602439.1 hypothetical protein FSUBG_7746 [Fusarium subglutinans]
MSTTLFLVLSRAGTRRELERCQKRADHRQFRPRGLMAKALDFGFQFPNSLEIPVRPTDGDLATIVQATGYRAPPSTEIDWSSHENSALPDLASRFRFTTHYALCVMDRELWESTSVSLLQKFRGARFWDHPGDFTMMSPSRSSRSNSSMRPAIFNACIPWSDGDIENIDSGEVIGQTDMSNKEITRDYTALREDWTYMPIFWNCHDLAIRLAYIIVRPSRHVIRVLKRLMILLRQACHKEIKWDHTAGNVCVGGWGVAALGGMASVPPLAMVGFGVFMVGWSVGFFGGIAVHVKEKARYEFMNKLEEKFPQLKFLHS